MPTRVCLPAAFRKETGVSPATCRLCHSVTDNRGVLCHSPRFTGRSCRFRAVSLLESQSKGESLVPCVFHRSIPMAIITTVVGAVLIVGLLATGSATSSALANTGASPVLVLRGTVLASSSASGHPAAYVNDGRVWTSWRASGPALPQWVTMDLGSPQVVTASTASWMTRDVGFRIYGSRDGGRWTRLANRYWNHRRVARTVIHGTWRLPLPTDQLPAHGDRGTARMARRRLGSEGTTRRTARRQSHRYPRSRIPW